MSVNKRDNIWSIYNKIIWNKCICCELCGDCLHYEYCGLSIYEFVVLENSNQSYICFKCLLKDLAYSLIV